MSTDDPAQAKLALEIEKLRLELLYIRRSFFAQIANTLTILVLGVAVLSLFQWPQIQSMEATRLAVEKQNVTNDLIAVFNMKDPQDRQRMLIVLADQFPQYGVISTMLRTEQVLSSEAATKSGGPTGRSCEYLSDLLQQLAKAKREVERQLSDEVNGTGGSGRKGAGPIARLLEGQMSDLETAESALEDQKRQLRCP
jgi:hypothetical protein